MSNNGEIREKKLRKTLKIPQIDDRLSSLPEGIIIDIFSRLSLESAITTGTLSRHFLNLWKQITSLKITTCYSKLFDAIDSLSSPKINTCEFQFSEPLIDDHRQFTALLNKVCEKQVKEIKVEFCKYDYYFFKLMMPENFLVSNDLEVLVLGFGINYVLCDDINLPNLRKLDICVNDSDIEFLGRLVKSCIVLEELRIRGDLMNDGHCIDVFGKNLKFLCVDMVRDSQLTTVRINAPKLESLRVGGPNLLKYCFVGEPSRVLCVEVCTMFYGGVSLNGSQEWEFVGSIRRAKSLVMQGDMSPAFYYVNDYQLPVFDGLTNLDLVFHFPGFWKAWMRFLQFCPNLQTVRLTRKDFPWYGSGWIKLDDVPDCLSSKVKSLILRDFKGVKEELELISYILMVAKVLENLHITIAAPRSDEFKRLQLRKQAEFCEGLCRLSESSSICKIKVNGKFLHQ